MRFVVATIVCALLITCAGEVYADDAPASLRIARPGSRLVRNESSVLDPRRSAPCCAASTSTPDCCSNHDISKHEHSFSNQKKGSSCCSGRDASAKTEDNASSRLSRASLEEAPQYFSSNLTAPQEHFGQWLKLSVYPALCHTVLCQRQCALNGYESCNALGVKRSILLDSMAGGSGCGPGGCQTGESVSAVSQTDESSSRLSKGNRLVTTHGAKPSER